MWEAILEVDGQEQARACCQDKDDVIREIMHYAMVYAQDGFERSLTVEIKDISRGR